MVALLLLLVLQRVASLFDDTGVALIDRVPVHLSVAEALVFLLRRGSRRLLYMSSTGLLLLV